jgi:hypothetical protein
VGLARLILGVAVPHFLPLAFQAVAKKGIELHRDLFPVSLLVQGIKITQSGQQDFISFLLQIIGI